jgi:hypothetical protein
MKNVANSIKKMAITAKRSPTLLAQIKKIKINKKFDGDYMNRCLIFLILHVLE